MRRCVLFPFQWLTAHGFHRQELRALTHCGVDNREGAITANPRLGHTSEASIGVTTTMAVVQLETGDRQPENGFVTPETASPELLTRIDESVLPFLGGFGKYQKQLIVLTWIPALFIGFSQFSDNFLLAQPNITCNQPLANVTQPPANHSSLLDSSTNISTQPVSLNPSGNSNAIDRMCNETTFDLQTGLVQNVVTKVSCFSGGCGSFVQCCYESLYTFLFFFVVVLFLFFGGRGGGLILIGWGSDILYKRQS